MPIAPITQRKAKYAFKRYGELPHCLLPHCFYLHFMQIVFYASTYNI